MEEHKWLFSFGVKAYIGSQWELRLKQISLLKRQNGLIEWMEHMDCYVSLFLSTSYSTLNAKTPSEVWTKLEGLFKK
jgi:hypothetical protein